MVETLSALAARPPTPPRVSSRSELLGQGVNRPGSADIIPGTPEDSPASSQAGLTGSQREPGSKRVNFSPWTDYIKPLSLTKSNSQPKPLLKALRPSNECKPAKSILKASAPAPPQSPSDPLRSNEPESLVTMWESVVQQLSGDSRSSRLDAYMSLFGALKAYDGLLDEHGMAEKIGLISQFIQRDIRQESSEYEPLDINLVAYALKLLTVLVWNPQLAHHLPDEFRAFVIDRATAAVQEPKTPKSIVTHYMHLLSTQTFQQRIMTSSRASKLLTILQNITDHVNGNGVIAQRLMIYQRLLTQCKPSMATNANLWVQHLLTGLFHHMKDTRAKAVAFGLQAATTFGPNVSISNAVRTTLSTPLEDDRKYMSEMLDHLMRMISSREKSAQVPQIWSIIILLLRTRKSPVEKWEHFKEWLFVIQKCFNCSDPATKTQALLAWNRFVYAVSPTESTGISMVRMLSKPILSQIERKKMEKLGTQPNATAFSSYCNLLYYTFRPSASHKQLDVFWKEYVVPPFSTVFNSGPTINDRASQVLSSILWNPQLKIWNENRANETTKLEPDELPVLDCKWVRSRVSTVLEVFESLFKTSSWREDDLHESSIALAWTSFSKALGEASSKEIKPSTESMHAIASILGMFQRLWNRGPAALNVGADCGDDAFLDRFRFLSKTIVSSLGPIPFTENLLLKSSSQETFQTANTPTHRRTQADKNCKTPILHFLHLIGSLPPAVQPGPAYRLLISEILDICSHARSSRGSRLDLFRQFAELHLHDVGDGSNPIYQSARYMWEVTSELVRDYLSSITPDTSKGRDGSLSRDHAFIVVKILEAGIRFRESWSEWSQLANALVDTVQAGKKEYAIVGTIIGQLSECFLNQDITLVIPHTGVLLKLAVHPDIRESLSPRPPRINPNPTHNVDHGEIGYGKLMDLTEKTLKDSYQRSRELDPSMLTNFIEAVDYSMNSCPTEVRPLVLERLQSSLSLWLADRDHLLGTDSVDGRKLLAAVRKLSKSVTSILQNLMEHDGQQLEIFEVLISSGLETFHKSTANTFILMWNNTFGLQSYLEYPKSVELALRKLEPFVDLQLPSFPRSTDQEEGEPTPPEFLESQDDLTNLALQMRSFDQQKLVSSPLNLVLSSRVNSSSPANRAGNHPVRPPEKNPTSTPKSRHRHDDSQVEFVAVESSPLSRHERESQYLTEHQRDVKERQRNETASMFPDFKSSSPSAMGKLTPGKLRGNSGLRTETGRDKPDDTPDDAPMTPTIAATLAENEEEFPVSSPTPTSQNPQAIPIRDLAEPSSCSTNEDIDALKPLDPPSSPPDSRSGRTDAEAASESIPPPEFEPDSQESREQGIEHVTENMPSGQPPVNHPKEDEEDYERDSGLEYVRQEMVGVSVPYSRPQSEEPASEGGSWETMKTTESTIQPAGPPLVDSTPDPTHISTEFSDTVDHGTLSQSNPTTGVDIIPDSFVSDLDDQIASQLSQDLELAVVLHRKEKEETPRKDKRSSRKKRLREQEAAAAASESPKRMRTRSSGNLPKAEEDGGRKSKRSRKSKTPKSTPVLSGQTKPEDHDRTLVSPLKTRSGRSKGTESQVSATKSQKRARSSEVDGEDRESMLTDSISDQPASKKKRSSRLRGQSVLSNISGEGSMTRRKHKAIQEKSRESVHTEETSAPQFMQQEEESKEIIRQQDDVNDSYNAVVVDNNANEGEGEVDNMEVSDTVSVPAIAAAPQLISQGTQTEMASAEREVEASEAGILGSLRRVLGAIRTVTWGRPALREIDDVMFDIRVEAHDANRRHDG